MKRVITIRNTFALLGMLAFIPLGTSELRAAHLGESSYAEARDSSPAHKSPSSRENMRDVYSREDVGALTQRQKTRAKQEDSREKRRFWEQRREHLHYGFEDQIKIITPFLITEGAILLNAQLSFVQYGSGLLGAWFVADCLKNTIHFFSENVTVEIYFKGQSVFSPSLLETSAKPSYWERCRSSYLAAFPTLAAAGFLASCGYDMSSYAVALTSLLFAHR